MSDAVIIALAPVVGVIVLEIIRRLLPTGQQGPTRADLEDELERLVRERDMYRALVNQSQRKEV